MNCLNHPEAPAVAYCRECGKALCEACRRQANGTIFCEEHLRASAWSAAQAPASGFSPYTEPPEAAAPYAAPPPPPFAPTTPPMRSSTADPGISPGLAFVLGFIPGVGAIYNGQYVKGIIHVFVFGFLIAIVNSDEASGNLQPLFGMLIAVWVFYMAFEAFHTAKRRQLGQPVDEFSSIVPRRGPAARFPLAPTVLIAVGLLFLLHNLNIIHITELIRYWPVALICLGAYMLYERLSGSPASPEPGAPHTREAANERR